MASKYAEEGKVALRNIRRDAVDKEKRDEKEGLISIDESRDNQLEIQKLESTIKQLNDELKRLNEQLRSEESNFNKQLEQEKRHERELEDAVKTRAKITKEHDRHHQHATKKICKRLQKLRIKLRKLEVFQKWLLADHRQIRKNLKEKRDLVKQLNGQLYECCFIIDLPELGGSKNLLDDGHNVYSILSLEEK